MTTEWLCLYAERHRQTQTPGGWVVNLLLLILKLAICKAEKEVRMLILQHSFPPEQKHSFALTVPLESPFGEVLNSKVVQA